MTETVQGASGLREKNEEGSDDKWQKVQFCILKNRFGGLTDSRGDGSVKI